MVKRIHWIPELVNKFWDGVEQTELDSLSFGKVAGPQFLELISDYLVPGGSCLDFGAGSGHVLQLLLDRGMSVAGFDPSPKRQAQLLARIGQHKNFLGVKGRDSVEQFDAVLLMEVVEHVLDDDFNSVLERAAQFVKPGGYLIASTPNNENLEYSSVYCPVSETLFHPWQHVRSFTPTQLANCFNNLGFSTEFIALADFSCDAERIEAHKKLTEAYMQLAEAHKKHIEVYMKLTEAYSEVISVQSLRASSLRQFSESIKLLVDKNQLQHKEFKLIDDSLASLAFLGFWQKIKFRLNLLLHHGAMITRLQSISRGFSQDIAHCFDEVSNYTQGQLKYTIALDPKPLPDIHNASDGMDIDITTQVVDDVDIDADITTQVVDGINLRIGKESTIVYVGKKK